LTVPLRRNRDFLGRPLGGFLFSVARVTPFLFDAITYAVSFVSLLFVRLASQEVRERARTRLRAVGIDASGARVIREAPRPVAA
jgi:hypothetical protein